METLLGLLDCLRGVSAPLEVCINVYTQELEAGHPLHILPIDADGLQVRLPPPEVNNQFFGLRGVNDQVVGLSPPPQPLNLVPVCRFIIGGDEPHHGGVIGELDDGIIWVGADTVIYVQSVQKRTQHTPCGEPVLRLRAVERC